MTSQVCEPRTEQVQASTLAVPVTAPPGQLITGWCVKAGSANQGLGPEEVTLEQPVTAATITHSSGKDVSHYVLRLVPAPSTTVPATTATPTTMAPTTAPATTVVVTTTAPEPSTTMSAPTETTVVVVDSTFPATTVAETAPPPVVVSTLPETGSGALTGAMGLLGAWAFGVGALLVWLTKAKYR